MVFGTIKKFLDLWVEHLSSLERVWTLFFFSPVLRSTNKKNTVFVREILKKMTFHLVQHEVELKMKKTHSSHTQSLHRFDQCFEYGVSLISWDR